MLSMAAEQPQGIRFGDQMVTWGARPSIRVGPGMLGRVIDTAGNPLDGKGGVPRDAFGDAGWVGAAAAGARSDSRAAGLRHSRYRRLCSPAAEGSAWASSAAAAWARAR